MNQPYASNEMHDITNDSLDTNESPHGVLFREALEGDGVLEKEVAAARNRVVGAERLVARARERELSYLSDTRASVSDIERLIAEQTASLASLQKARACLKGELELAQKRAFGDDVDPHSVEMDGESKAKLRTASAEQQVLREAAREQVWNTHVYTYIYIC